MIERHRNKKYQYFKFYIYKRNLLVWTHYIFSRLLFAITTAVRKSTFRRATTNNLHRCSSETMEYQMLLFTGSNYFLFTQHSRTTMIYVEMGRGRLTKM